MKDINIIKEIYLEKYDINVHPYLCYSEIQQIVEATRTCENWSDKQTNIDMLVLYHATDLTKEDLEKYTHDEWLQSGIIDDVYNSIKNLNQLYQAIEWSEGKNCVERLLGNFLKNITNITNLAIQKNLHQLRNNNNGKTNFK